MDLLDAPWFQAAFVYCGEMPTKRAGRPAASRPAPGASVDLTADPGEGGETASSDSDQVDSDHAAEELDRPAASQLAPAAIHASELPNPVQGIHQGAVSDLDVLQWAVAGMTLPQMKKDAAQDMLADLAPNELKHLRREYTKAHRKPTNVPGQAKNVPLSVSICSDLR